MQFIRKRFDYLTGTTPGLVLMATAWDALAVAMLGMLSGPMREIIHLPITLDDAERTGRLVMLYHSLAIPFVAAITYFILEMVPMPEGMAKTVRRTITPGYMLTTIGGLGFAYLGRSWVLHGLFIFGLSLVFYAGVVLMIALWPWRYPNENPAYAHIGSLSLERMAFFVVAVTMLVSVLIGAVAASYFGNGFEAVLAEDVVREEHTLGQLAVIAHLHIVLALIDVAILLLIVRAFDMKGGWHKAAMPLIIVGTIVMSFGCWGVMLWEDIAHDIIYAGSSLVLLGALFVVIDGIGVLIREQLAEMGIQKATFGQKMKALVRDPLRFGYFFQIIWVQFVMVFPGLYTAVKLDMFRSWPLEDEKRILTGHWHILATASAVIMVLMVADRLKESGWMRQLLGWGLLFGANLAFTAATFYEFIPPEADRDWTTPYLDAGLGLALIVLAIFLGGRLIDLFRARGRWAEAA